MMIQASIPEIPLRDIKREFNARGVQPSVRDLIAFASELEVESVGLKPHEIQAALWFAVDQMVELIQRGTSFSSALSRMKWASRVSSSTTVPISRVMTLYRSRPPEITERERKNEVHVRLKELIGTFLLDQDVLVKEFDRSLNPFRRRKLSKMMRSLDDFLANDARSILTEEFPNSPYVEEWVRTYLRKDPQHVRRAVAITGRWHRRKFSSWVADTIEELEQADRSGWQDLALSILHDNYPSRRDDDHKALRKALSIWREFDGHSDPNLSTLAVDLRSRFGVGV